MIKRLVSKHQLQTAANIRKLLVYSMQQHFYKDRMRVEEKRLEEIRHQRTRKEETEETFDVKKDII